MRESVLVFDAGNQRLKWACMPLRELGHFRQTIRPDLSRLEGFCSGVVDTKQADGSDAPVTLADDVKDIVGAPVLILSSSVASAKVSQQIAEQCRRHWQVDPVHVTAASSVLDLGNGYDDPAQLGSDRWFAACAAWQIVNGASGDLMKPVVCIDAGTAITVDLITNGVFRGGAILPGLTTIIRTLGTKTGQIDIDIVDLLKQAMRKNLNVIPCNTGDAVLTGAIAAARGGIDYAVRQLSADLPRPPVVCVTGGDAAVTTSALEGVCVYSDHLVLAGLLLETGERLS